MNGINLFEQQALQQRQFRAPHVAQAALPRPTEPEALHYIEAASLDQCRKVALHLSARLFSLEKRYSGMKASNLNEAAHFAADVATDIAGAMQAADEAPCTCGDCDSCTAARADEHHDRRRDGAAA